MDLSRLKKVLAGMSVAAITLTQFGVKTAFAAYSDVPSGVWYGEAVSALTDDGVLDASQARFRGGDLANRAEFVKLIVMMNGGLLSTPPAVASFDDVKSSAWYYAYMEEAGKEGWVKGDGNCYGSHPCYSRPGANINRAEAAALIVRAFNLEATGDAAQFVDNPSGQWYTDAIQSAADHCVLQGDDSTGRVRPNDNMNRAEMVVMLYRVDQGLMYGQDCGGNSTTEAGIQSARALSSMVVEVVFNQDVDQASAEMASNYAISGASPAVTVTSVKQTADDTVELTLSSGLSAGSEYTVTASDIETADGDTFSDSASFNGYSSLPSSKGTLEVSVSSKNPVGDTVPQGAVGVTMLSMDLTSSCDEAVAIEDVTVLHEGFGAQSDIDGVYLAQNGTRLSRKRSIDSKDQTGNIHLSQPLTIAACKTVTLDLVADFISTATTAAEHNFAVELPSDFTSNAKQVTGNFPLRGSTFKVAAVRSGKLSVGYRTVSPDEVEVGDKTVVLGKFELSSDSVEDQTLYSVTVEQNGTAGDGDVTNLKIRRSDGTVISNTVATTVGDFATFVFDPPFTILEGDRMTFELVGDVVGGSGESVIMHFEEDSDVFAVGSLYGYGVNGQLYGSRVTLPTSDNASTVTIDAGEFTIEIDGPVQQTYTRDQNDAILANIIFTTGGERIDVKKLFIAIAGTTSSGQTFAFGGSTASDTITEVLENVTLRNKTTGRTVSAVNLGSSAAGTATISSTNYTYQIYRFDDFTVNGKETYEFRVDFKDNGTSAHPLNGDTFRVHICGEPKQVSTGTNTVGCVFGGLLAANTSSTYQMEIEGLSTGDTVNDIRPRGTITGNAHRIAGANLTVAVKSGAATDTAVKNSKNINLLRFEARAGEAKDVLFTKAIFASNAGSLNNGQNYTLWVDTDADGKVDTILEKGQSAQNSKVTFNQLTGGGFVIPKEKTVVFEVHADIAASLTDSQLQLKFSTGDTSYIEAEQVDRGSALSGIKTDSASCTSCDIIVTTATSTLYSLVSQGSLIVSKDTTTLRSHQLLGGTLGDPVLRLQLHAEYEDVDVTDLQLTSSGSRANSVDRLELYKDGATAPFASATVGGCGSDDVLTQNQEMRVTTFCAKMQSRQLVVPKGGPDVKISVRPRMKSDVDGATSGTGVTFFITSQPVSNNASGSGAVRARGDQSSNNLVANDGHQVAGGQVVIRSTGGFGSGSDIIGAKNLTVLSKITSITNANPDANGSIVPTGVSAIGQFKFSAAPHNNSKNGTNKVTLSGAVFNIDSNNVILSSFALYNKTTGSSITSSCTAKNSSNGALASASGSFAVVCGMLGSSSVNTSIDQGSDETFVLQANVTKVTGQTSFTLQVSLQNFNNIGANTFGPGTASTVSHLDWIDDDSGTLSTSGTTTESRFLWVEYTDTTVKSTSYQQS